MQPTKDYSQENLDVIVRRVWEVQKNYNENLKVLCPERSNPARWTEILLLGLINECEELLSEIGWKRHRGEMSKLSTRKINRDNLAAELSDISKYVLSLWQVWGFTDRQMFLEILQKSAIMDMRLSQEFHPLPPKGSRVLVVDIDDTLADLRYGLWRRGVELAIIDPMVNKYNISNINPDIDFGIDYRKFQMLKEKFILAHGYETLLTFDESAELVRKAIQDGVYVIACTARPADKYPHIWLETQKWLEENHLEVNQLHIGREVRIQIILELAEQGYDTVLMDNDPELIERALNSGIRVAVQKYPYNAHLWRRQNVRTVKDILTEGSGFPFSGGND